jgi:hypothetical protein
MDWAAFNSELVRSELEIDAREEMCEEGDDREERRGDQPWPPQPESSGRRYAPTEKFNVASVVVDEPSNDV